MLKHLFTHPVVYPLTTLITSDGSLFACFTEGNLALLRVDTREVVTVFRGHGNYVWSIDEHPSGEYFATGCDDYKVRIFERRGALVATMQHGGTVWCVKFSPDGSLLA